MPGSLGIVDFGNEPASVPDDLLQAIQQKVDRSTPCRKTVPEFAPGEIVTIIPGLLPVTAQFRLHFQPGGVLVLMQMLQEDRSA